MALHQIVLQTFNGFMNFPKFLFSLQVYETQYSIEIKALVLILKLHGIFRCYGLPNNKYL